jgi:phage FluMu protein Com
VTPVHSQFVVSVGDIRFATLLCRHCNTRVTLDLDAEFKPGSKHVPFESPRECPRCHTLFDSVIPGAVNALQKIYKALAGLEDAVTFTGGEADADADPA